MARLFPWRGLLAIGCAVHFLVALGCSQDRSLSIESRPPGTPTQGSPTRAELSAASPEIAAAIAVQNRHTPALMQNPDIVGTATGLTEDGRPAVLVFAATDLPPGAVPTVLDGVPVVVQVTGPLKARKGPPAPAVSHKTKQAPPIQLGTSGGWRFNLSNGYCCGGTIGALVAKDGKQFVLSNYHVLYADTDAIGDSSWQPGDPVVQPGLIDVACNAGNAQNVATLVASGGSLPGANVDSAIAEVVPGMVQADGSILEVGTISATIVAAAVNKAVKKSGRTTGLSRATVIGLNGTVSIGYDTECAGSAAFTQTFTGQVIASNSRCKFLDGGDSGSLMVEDADTNPHPVGLLFAGSTICGGNAIAIANPIGDVLAFHGVTLVGN